MKKKQNKKNNIPEISEENIEKPKEQKISYRGEVTISLNRNGKTFRKFTVKNEGKPKLFKGIALSLINERDESLIPNFIGVSKTSDSSYHSVAKVPINYRSAVSDTSNELEVWSAILGAIIPYSSILGSDKITRIELYGRENDNEEDILAVINLSTENELQVSSGVDIIIQ